ncbi:PREDICTED: pre-mRNA 3'-end-processing factor FIP1-like [Acropora digitifera]|uniref:pre-mRNA 3'-end-processing factor FIP1-like n=1 Tax=Acropora digitifera TaxID=70779 RepID=UPI00077A391A|nr:PREDICTED: pre-mRNA 3'-end-processing factor FIP1-like [Acropora digitifera]
MADVEDDEKFLYGGLFKMFLQFSHPLRSAPYTTPSNWTFKPGTGAASVKERTAIGKDGKGINVDAVGTVNGVSIHEFDLDSVDDKPWRKPGADITDYFNYGFTEDTWKQYCEKQRRMRMEPQLPKKILNYVSSRKQD